MESESRMQSDDDIIASVLDEFMQSVRKGKQPDVSQFVSLYPQLEQEIRELLPLVSMVENANVVEDAPSTSMPETIGQYRIIEEVGRGGMGVVYRAVQQSLDREVALKVLPPQLISKGEARERFLREATAAASLHHTNIAPVFEVGEDHGLYFYAMQFIEGEALHEVRNRIRDAGTPNSVGSAMSDQQARLGVELLSGSQSHDSFGTPYFRSVAKVGVQIADALHYAHSRGIIHRDVKPANLILDPSGVVWLTDFGLAKTETDDMTRTGQFPGTARYMSPERFRGECTERSDVYALGATLYELLTLRPAFEARDHLQLVEQIGLREPTPLREIDRRIPRDLETIVLKAMEKEPRRRYSTAFDLMEDLRRFCAGEPIQARSVTPVERAIKWARRRPAVTGLAILLLFVGTAGFTVSSLKWAEAVRERDQKALAQEKAEQNLKYAREAIERMLSQVGDKRLANIPRMEKLRRNLLMDAVELNRRFIVETDDPDVLLDVAMTHSHLGRIFQMLNEQSEALREFQEARLISELLAKDHPENLDHQADIAVALQSIAGAHLAMGELDECEKQLGQSIQILTELIARHPGRDDFIYEMFFSQARQADLHETRGEFDDSIRTMQQALTTFSTMTDHGQNEPGRPTYRIKCEVSLAGNLLMTDRIQEAENVVSAAVEQGDALLPLAAQNQQLVEAVAGAHRMKYAVIRKLGQREESFIHIRRAIELFERLSKEYPHVITYQSSASNSAIGLAVAHAEAGEFEDAERWFQFGNQSAQSLAGAYPDIREIQYQAAAAARMIGIFYQNTRQTEKGATNLQAAIERLESILVSEQENADLKLEIAKALHALGTNYRTLSEFESALDCTRRAIELEESLLEQTNNMPLVRHKLAQDVRQYGEILESLDRADEAGSHFQRAIEIERTVIADSPDNTEHHRHLAIALHHFARWLVDQKQAHNSLPYIDESITIRQKLAKEQPDWFHPQVEIPDAFYCKASALIAVDRRVEARACYEQGLTVCELLLPAHRDNPHLRTSYATGLEQLVELEDQIGERSVADEYARRVIAFHEESLTIDPENDSAKSAIQAMKTRTAK